MCSWCHSHLAHLFSGVLSVPDVPPSLGIAQKLCLFLLARRVLPKLDLPEPLVAPSLVFSQSWRRSLAVVLAPLAFLV